MDAIILAAGNSSRFGSNKLLYEVQGKCMYEYIVDHMLQLKAHKIIDHVIFVTQYKELEEKITRKSQEIIVVENKSPECGIAHSIYLGMLKLLEVNPDSKECMFAVSDQPFLRYESLKELAKAFAVSSQGIGVCACGNRMGNPVIFSEVYYTELKKMVGDVGGKQVAMKHLDDVFLFQVEQKELEDIDNRCK